MSRLDEIRARLDEIAVHNGREVWHAQRCAYLDGFDCDCFRSDIEVLVGLLDQRPAPFRCRSRKSENDGKRTWRCSLDDGHDGGHESTGGRRAWT